MQNRIKLIRQSKKITAQALADGIGTSRSMIEALQKGDRPLNDRWIRKISNFLGVKPKDLIADEIPMARVIGRAGAGGEVFPIDDEPIVYSNMVMSVHDNTKQTRFRARGDGPVDDCGEYIECPEGENPHEIGAIRVEGDSMLPQLEDGWFVFINRRDVGNIEECIGKLCVVKILGGKTLIKKLYKGSAFGRYNLYSHNASLIENIEIEWCARVFDIRPK